MSKEREKMSPEGALQLLRLYLDIMTTRKLVSLFEDYEKAKQDLILELAPGIKDDDDDPIGLLTWAIEQFESIMHLKEWYDELGKGGKSKIA